jgi:protein-L-isoaspartate O-methyltransferase
MTASRSAGVVRRPARLGDAEARRRERARSRLRVRAAALFERLWHVLGVRRTVVVGRVRYLEREQLPLRRALSARGPGHKEYSVRFEDGSRMRIRCTGERVYADLMIEPRLEIYVLAMGRIRPGDRVLEVGCGTGAGAEQLARAVGPSGAVVALERDRESIRFARRRYGAPHLAFEIGGVEALTGELDGAFDVCVVGLDTGTATAADIAEVWRCVAPGGALLVWPDDGALTALEGECRRVRLRSGARTACMVLREDSVDGQAGHKPREEDDE